MTNWGACSAFWKRRGLASNTLVVLTSDHGEMGGDHWLLEKCGYWDESFHIPLVVRDPFAPADATRGLVVRQPTESVDVSATVLDWLGLEVPRQVDGWPLTPFLRTGAAPEHWRTAAHWEWDMRHAQLRVAEQYFGIPSEHCSLAVVRSDGRKVRSVRSRCRRLATPAVRPPGRPRSHLNLAALRSGSAGTPDSEAGAGDGARYVEVAHAQP
jgi:arylsulfatase A-like enzyme